MKKGIKAGVITFTLLLCVGTIICAVYLSSKTEPNFFELKTSYAVCDEKNMWIEFYNYKNPEGEAMIVGKKHRVKVMPTNRRTNFGRGYTFDIFEDEGAEYRKTYEFMYSVVKFYGKSFQAIALERNQFVTAYEVMVFRYVDEKELEKWKTEKGF